MSQYVRMPLHSGLDEYTYLLPMGHLDLLVERAVGDGSHAPVSEELRSRLIIFVQSHPTTVYSFLWADERWAG